MELEILSDKLSASSSADDLLTISVDIGDGRKDSIKINVASNPEQLALDFCTKHQLGAKAKILLADEIEKNLLNLPKRALLALPLQATLSTGHGSSTPGDLTESTLKFSPNIKEKEKTKELKQVRQLKTCLYKPSVKKSSLALPPETKDLQSKVLSKTLGTHKKSYSSLLRPADSKNFALSPYLFNSKAMESPPRSRNSPRPGLQGKSNQTSPDPQKKIINLGSPNRSDQLIRKMKEKSYSRIFQMLNPDNSGRITALTVQDAPKTKEISIISPVIEEMKTMNETLNFQEFFDAMEILMKFLTLNDKNFILIPSKNKIEQKPEVKTRAKTIHSIPDLYDRCVSKKNDSIRRMAAAREQTEQIELQECFFQPNLGQSCKSSSKRSC
jgi:hypothetical protein